MLVLKNLGCIIGCFGWEVFLFILLNSQVLYPKFFIFIFYIIILLKKLGRFESKTPHPTLPFWHLSRGIMAVSRMLVSYTIRWILYR